MPAWRSAGTTHAVYRAERWTGSQRAPAAVWRASVLTAARIRSASALEVASICGRTWAGAALGVWSCALGETPSQTPRAVISAATIVGLANAGIAHPRSQQVVR